MACSIDWYKLSGDTPLTHVCWEEEGHVLWLAYNSGNAYRFSGVPERLFKELMKAPKPSRFARANILHRFEMERFANVVP